MLERVKRLLGQSDTDNDELLEQLIEMTGERLCALLGDVPEIPRELEYVIVEVVVRRFNRIGSEGFASHSVEGETMSIDGDDFAAYARDIEAWKQNHNVAGKVRFI